MPGHHWRFDDEGMADEVTEARRMSAYFAMVPATLRRQAAQQQFEIVE